MLRFIFIIGIFANAFLHSNNSTKILIKYIDRNILYTVEPKASYLVILENEDNTALDSLVIKDREIVDKILNHISTIDTLNSYRKFKTNIKPQVVTCDNFSIQTYDINNDINARIMIVTNNESHKDTIFMNYQNKVMRYNDLVLPVDTALRNLIINCINFSK